MTPSTSILRQMIIEPTSAVESALGIRSAFESLDGKDATRLIADISSVLSADQIAYGLFAPLKTLIRERPQF